MKEDGDDVRWMRLALREAEKAGEEDEVEAGVAADAPPVPLDEMPAMVAADADAEPLPDEQSGHRLERERRDRDNPTQAPGTLPY